MNTDTTINGKKLNKMDNSNEINALRKITSLINDDCYLSKDELGEILGQNNLLSEIEYICPCGTTTYYSNVPVIPTCSSCGESFYISVKKITIK